MFLTLTLTCLLTLVTSFALPAGAAVAPVGQLPSVTVSAIPSPFVLPILLVTDQDEWKDFGIQINLKIYANGEEQADRAAGSEWDVGIMDPFNAIKAGNEGDVAIVGIAGDFVLGGFSHLAPIRPGPPSWADLGQGEMFLPACLVASASYADTRKTLILRWLEGYSRGVRLLLKNPAAAASRLQKFYRENLKTDVPPAMLERELGRAFFDEEEQTEIFRGGSGIPSPIERFARRMSDFQVQNQFLKEKKDPAEYILGNVCGQLAALRGEAEGQFRKTRAAIDLAEKEGNPVAGLRRQLDQARRQMEEGRGCLTVIGVLSNLMRSAEQAQLESVRFKQFRRIEWGIGGIMAAYYAGYAVRRRRRS